MSFSSPYFYIYLIYKMLKLLGLIGCDTILNELGVTSLEMIGIRIHGVLLITEGSYIKEEDRPS